MLLLGASILVTTCLIGVIVAVGYVLHVAQAAPKLTSLHPLIGRGSSELFAADGTSLGFIRANNVRSPVSSAEIPADLNNATVAIEDQRFYHNDGVDPTAILRAAIKDALNGEALQGGSTITMQLVRNLYLGSDQRTLKQKIIEAKLAIEYNETHSKRSILTSYLNSVPYTTVAGQTALGVQAAARIIFDEPVSQLNLAQTALLAGLPQAPSEYNPFRHPGAARERRNVVLAKMAELHYISPGQAAAAQAAPLEIKLGNFYSQRREDFFFEYVREQLEQRYGRETVEQGGLKVYTTLDLNMQGLARKAIGEVLNEPGDPASAIVTLDPHNGDIEAMAESESYEQSQYNLAADGHRQPGSTFKAIDLADALTRGVDPYTTYYDSKALPAGWLAGYPEYPVKTFDGTYAGPINLVQATVKSDNTVFAQVAADLGEESITQMAYQMGVKTHLSSYPAEALGGLTLGVTPLEMAERLRDARRWRLSQHPDRDHQGRLPRRPGRQQLGYSQPGQGAERRHHRRRDEHPSRQRRGRHRDTLGDRLPDSRQDRHDRRTHRRLARRLHPRILNGRMDGLSQQTHLDDRCPRRAAAGRLPARGNLARLHGGRHRRPAVRAVPAAQGTDLIPPVLRTFRADRTGPAEGKSAGQSLPHDPVHSAARQPLAESAERREPGPQHRRTSDPRTGSDGHSRNAIRTGNALDA